MTDETEKVQAPANEAETEKKEDKQSKKEESLMRATCTAYIKLFKFIEKLANERNLIANVMNWDVNFKRRQLNSKGTLRTFDGAVEIDFSQGKITPRDVEEINGFLIEEIGL